MVPTDERDFDGLRRRRVGVLQPPRAHDPVAAARGDGDAESRRSAPAPDPHAQLVPQGKLEREPRARAAARAPAVGRREPEPASRHRRIEVELRRRAERREFLAAGEARPPDPKLAAPRAAPPSADGAEAGGPASAPPLARQLEIEALDARVERDGPRIPIREVETERPFAKRARADEKRGEFRADDAAPRREGERVGGQLGVAEERGPGERDAALARRGVARSLGKEPAPRPFERRGAEGARRRVPQVEARAADGRPAERNRERDGEARRQAPRPHRLAPPAGATAIVTDARRERSPAAAASSRAT
ncbi:MAG TPA: hypothetical protein VFS09_06440 [Candidatus Eisenbacteria bacterium]|nr:hypothetical protein [Candidatus Eisenbacteria bacterium]